MRLPWPLPRRHVGTTAKVVMPATSSPFRVEACRALGGEVVLTQDVTAAFERVEQIQAEEGRTFVHPFEGPLTALGTATVGLEFCNQVSDLDAAIIPVGGGGLIGGDGRGDQAVAAGLPGDRGGAGRRGHDVRAVWPPGRRSASTGCRRLPIAWARPMLRRLAWRCANAMWMTWCCWRTTICAAGWRCCSAA